MRCSYCGEEYHFPDGGPSSVSAECWECAWKTAEKTLKNEINFWKYTSAFLSAMCMLLFVILMVKT